MDDIVEMEANRETFRDPHLYIRFTEMIFAIISFSVVAEGHGNSRINYAIFCGVTTMALSFLFCLCYLGRVSAVRSYAAMVVDGLWWIFWLSNAGALTATIGSPSSDQYHTSQSRLQCAAAFAWMTWMLLWVSLFLDYTDVRSGNGGKIIVLPRPTTKGRADAAQQRPGQQRGGGGRPPAGALSAVA